MLHKGLTKFGTGIKNQEEKRLKKQAITMGTEVAFRYNRG